MSLVNLGLQNIANGHIKKKKIKKLMATFQSSNMWVFFYVGIFY